MNCQYFENIINDLARDQLMDQTARKGAIDHASTCARCSTRLADERMLSAGLRRLSAGEGAEEAPAAVEARLLRAFREQRMAVPSVTLARARRWPRWAAAAAAILILVALAAIGFNQTGRVAPVEQAYELKLDQQLAAPGKVSPGGPGRIAATQRQQRASQRNVIRNQKESPASAVGSDATGEVATDFIPLMRGDSLNSMESGQIVRVELPRSALVSFGLPMNMELADERIKADVVVGNDGLARAIRFVR